MGDWTGSVPTYAAGDEVKASNMQIETAIETAVSDVWTTWTPTLTNLTATTATQVAKYRRVGKTVDFIWSFVLGAASAVGTSPSFTLPVAPSTDWAISGDTLFPMMVRVIDAGVGHYDGEARLSGSTVTLFYKSSVSAISNITATTPMTWATGDALSVNGTYYTA